ncbi:histone H1.5-like [Scyliorhinus canicula]|uniref:histone H1.5-like n=1 Tax=Scyliorhinus canicula TaxID=7830 RepID=UPI0018F6B96C|nr:histone H1.5-like [Scyliorhinus canicula]
MAEAAPIETAPAPTPQAKTAKKAANRKEAASGIRSKPTGPSLSEQILKLVAESTERHGMSVTSIKKALSLSGLDVHRSRGRIKLAISKCVANGSLLHTKGIGASGSVKLHKKGSQSKKVKKTKKAATASGTKVSKNVSKKSPDMKLTKKSPAKKTTSKKSPAKKLTRKSPEKKLTSKSPAKKLTRKSPAKKPKAITSKPASAVAQAKATRAPKIPEGKRHGKK